MPAKKPSGEKSEVIATTGEVNVPAEKSGPTWKVILLLVVGFLLLLALWMLYPRSEGSEEGVSTSIKEKVRYPEDDEIKVPYNTKSLELALKDPIDPMAFSSGSITLNPSITGEVKLSEDKKILSYILGAPLQIGESYELSLTSGSLLIDGTRLVKDQSVRYFATTGPKVINIFPKGNLDTLSQNITVIFSTPMVPLTNLEKKDILPCPLTIKPALAGKCIWTTTMILEFIPSEPLHGATRYELAILDMPGLLHGLSESATGEFITTPLRISTNSEFSPKDGITLNSNFPISLESLSRSLTLTSEGDTAVSGEKGASSTPLEAIIEAEKNEEGTMSDTRFTIRPKNGQYIYGRAYRVSVKKGLSSIHGNMPLENDVSFFIKALPFLSGVSAYQNEKNGSGEVVDTKSYTYMIPNDDVFFLASFTEEIPLDDSLISLRALTGGELIPFSLSYGKREVYDEDTGKFLRSVDDKQELKITPKNPLNKEVVYEFIVKKNANPFMKSDERKTFLTAKDFVVSGFKLVSNTEGCIYTNNRFRDDDEYNTFDTIDPTKPLGRIVTNPLSRAPKLRFDSGVNTWTPDGSFYTTVYTCPKIEGQYAYIVDMRLNPLLSYSVSFLAGLRDEYGQKLSKDIAFTMKTGPTAPKDRYLYSSAEGNEIQVIPASLPIVLGTLSVNTDALSIDACEMDEDEYIAYLTSQRGGYGYSFPDCKKKISKKISVKNRNWTTTPTKIDIEKEVLSGSTSSRYIHLRASLENPVDNVPQEFRHTFIRSNLSLTLEEGANKRILFASSYDGKILPSDLNFQAYRWVQKYGEAGRYEKLPKLSIRYDTEKKYYTLTDPKETIDILIAKNASYHAIIDFTQDQASNYDFKYISGQDASEKNYLYIYPDRPLYKPADTVYFKGILRNFRFDGYRPSELKSGTVRVIGGQGSVSGEVTVAELDVKVDENSNIHGEFVMPQSVPLGRYRFEFTGSGQPIYNNGEFFLEAYKKPVFKVITSIDKDRAVLGETSSLAATAEYYFGGRLSQAAYQYSILTQKYYFDPKEYKDYHFGIGYGYNDCLYWGYCDYNDSMIKSGTGKLDLAGETSLKYKYTPGEDDGERIYTYNIEVTDPDTGKTVNNSASQILHMTDGYVGIKTPYWNSGKKGIKTEGVILDTGGKPLSGKKVGLSLVRREWKTVKKEGVDGVFYNEGALEETLIEKKEIESDKNGDFSYNFQSATGGEYEVLATYTGSNKSAFTSSSYAYVSGSDEYNWYESNNSVADLTADRSILTVGEKAGFTLKTPIEQGKMLVSIEKDDGILDAYIMDISGTTTRIELLVLDTYIPNIYIKVFALGQNPGEKLPIYKRALSVIKVLPDPKRLTVSVTPEKTKYLPGEAVKLTISVKDARGNPVASANGSISIVDQSLLALAGNPLKNPFAYFYDMKRYLGVSTYTSLQNLIKKLEVKDTSLGEKGGAGEGQKGGLSKKKRGLFKDTAYWKADFVTDKNGNHTLTTQALPDNLTTWVIETLVNTKTSDFGIAQATIQTSKNVLINDNLPRFLGTSDTIEIAPVIFNKTDKDSIFDVSIEATQASIKNPKQNVMIKKGEQVPVVFTLEVDSIAKVRSAPSRGSKITIKAVSRETSELDIIEMTLPIVETTTRELVATSGRADPRREEVIELQDDIRSNGGLLDIRYSGTRIPGLLSGIDFLTSFPYGCIEQKLATIMPKIYMKQLYESVGIPYDFSKQKVSKYLSKEEGYAEIPLKDVINEVIQSIPSYQMYDGGFGYWNNGANYNSDLGLTITLLSRLEDIEALGFPFDKEVKKRAAGYIKSLFYRNQRPYCLAKDCTYDYAERINMVNGVLSADKDDYEGYKMYQLVLDEIKTKQSVSSINPYNSVEGLLSQARLLLKLSAIKDVPEGEKDTLRKQAREILDSAASNHMVMNARGAFIGRESVYNRLANTLDYIELVSLFGSTFSLENTDILDAMNRWVMTQKQKDGSFGSTLDTTRVIRAITRMEQSLGAVKSTDFEANITLDSNLIEKKTIDSKNRLDTFQKILPLDTLKESSTLVFEKSGTGKIYYDIGLEYHILARDVPSRDEGFYLESSYYDYAEYLRIEKAQKLEWDDYIAGKKNYKELKYQNEITTYLKPLSILTIGKLIYVHHRMILGEPRDQVAFEGFIPAGAELVNPNLKTESQDVRNQEPSSWSIFDHEEWQDDRYFATTRSLGAGVYTFGYIFRPTHAGTYDLRPSRLFEFYHPEVFGRTAGKTIDITR